VEHESILPNPLNTLVLECIDGAQGQGIASALGFTPQYSIKAFIMENIEKDHTGRNIYSF
jgi:hypothetical protein